MGKKVMVDESELLNNMKVFMEERDALRIIENSRIGNVDFLGDPEKLKALCDLLRGMLEEAESLKENLILLEGDVEALAKLEESKEE
ncbi:MAG: hypothetical protein HY555_03840 [Euryarchaeota archaeon]|nr:hypothetical protein [Euryarchaeota archaeon]